MSVKITSAVTWVGKTDWQLRRFHGNEYSTHRGTTYNSYLVSYEKTALIDTVWAPFAKEYVAGLTKAIDPGKIDYIIANHGEIDHSGALPELMDIIPDRPIYCTANAVKSLKGQYHRDWNFNTVKTGDRLSLGSRELIFIESPMLHWPDNMMCYLAGDNILFSNDAFGQHYATSGMFNDAVNQDELFAECIKYYANILTPFSHLVTKKIHEFLSLKLPLDMICTSHGVIWRANPAQIVEKYLQWADAYQEDQVTIVYDTMWNGTRVMAENIAAGIMEMKPDTAVKLYNASNTDKNDIITEIFKSKAVGIGSPSINQGVLSAVAAILEEMRGLKFKKKKGFGFGCYGWSGESVKMISEGLQSAGFECIGDGIRALWNPDDDAVKACVDFGRKVAGEL